MSSLLLPHQEKNISNQEVRRVLVDIREKLTVAFGKIA
jgi:hypothetical protein